MESLALQLFKKQEQVLLSEKRQLMVNLKNLESKLRVNTIDLARTRTEITELSNVKTYEDFQNRFDTILRTVDGEILPSTQEEFAMDQNTKSTPPVHDDYDYDDDEEDYKNSPRAHKKPSKNKGWD